MKRLKPKLRPLSDSRTLCSLYPSDSLRNSLIKGSFQLFPELKYKCYQKFASIAPSLTVIDFFAPEINWSVVEYLFPHQRKFQIRCWMWQKKTKNMIARNLFNQKKSETFLDWKTKEKGVLMGPSVGSIGMFSPVLLMLYILGNLDSSWTNWAISEHSEMNPWNIGILMTPVWYFTLSEKLPYSFTNFSTKHNSWQPTQTHKKNYIKRGNLTGLKTSESAFIVCDLIWPASENRNEQQQLYKTQITP